MNCIDAYREALTRVLSSTASSASSTASSAPAPSQRQAAEAGRAGPVHPGSRTKYVDAMAGVEAGPDQVYAPYQADPAEVSAVAGYLRQGCPAS